MSSESKIKRVSKACDSCRRRKIKCDGDSPCNNCVNYKCECTYNYIEKKRVITKKPSSVKQFESRLGRMEKIMEHFINKIDAVPSKKLISLLSSNSDEDMSTQSEDEQDQEVPDCDVKPEIKEKTKSIEHYFGSQSSFSIFSQQGLKWIQLKLGNHPPSLTLIKHLKDMHHYIHQISSSSYSQWIDPISKDQISELPPQEITNGLLGSFFGSLTGLIFIDEKQIIDIFDSYYYNLSNPNNKSKLSHSDSLIMNSILLLTTSLESDLDSIKGNLSDMDELNKNKQTMELQARFLANAIFYYQRICFLGDGIKAIQGMLILALYVETTLLTQTNFILVSTAIRFAQELGMNRIESFYGLSEDEIDRRKRLWWYLYFMDRDIGLKSGKPTIISDSDVSTPFPKDLQKLVSAIKTKNEIHINETFINVVQEKGFTYSFSFYHVSLSQITSRSYEYLFNANSLTSKSNIEILKNIKQLNSDLEDFKNSIDKPVRPDCEIDLKPYAIFGEGEDPNVRMYTVLMLQFSYYFHLMIINRTAFRIPTKEQEAVFGKENDCPTTICLNASRKILTLTRKLNIKSYNFISWALFYPFSAFITIFCSCIENPGDRNTVNDIKLLMDSSFKFFQNPKPQTSKRHLKWDTADVIIRQLLKVVLKVYENNCHENLLSDKSFKNLDKIESYQNFLKTGSILTATSKIPLATPCFNGNASIATPFNDISISVPPPSNTPSYIPPIPQPISDPIPYDIFSDQLFDADGSTDGSHFFQTIFNLPNFLIDDDALNPQVPSTNFAYNNNFGY